MSSLPCKATNCWASVAIPSSVLCSSPSFTAPMMAAMGSALLEVMRLARPMASFITRPVGTTLFTRPMRYASCAVMGSPVSMISRALPLPTMRGSR